jgi:hypothetical protein
MTGRTAKENAWRGDSGALVAAGAEKDAGRGLEEGQRALEQPVEGSQNAGRHSSLQQWQPEGGHSTLLLNRKTRLCQVLAHVGRMKVKVERDELDRMGIERAPILAVQQVAQYSLDVALVGVFQYKVAPRTDDTGNFTQYGWHVPGVV